jgi:hypothetical protein
MLSTREDNMIPSKTHDAWVPQYKGDPNRFTKDETMKAKQLALGVCLILSCGSGTSAGVDGGGRTGGGTAGGMSNSGGGATSGSGGGVAGGTMSGSGGGVAGGTMTGSGGGSAGGAAGGIAVGVDGGDEEPVCTESHSCTNGVCKCNAGPNKDSVCCDPKIPSCVVNPCDTYCKFCG